MSKNAPDRVLSFLKPWLQFRYEQLDLPGFVITIRHKNRVVFNEAFGYADVKRGIKLMPGHVFRVASHSKSFTAVAIMQLREQGKMQLDDPVISHLPWLKEHRDRRWRHVTIRQLLCHGAGVIRDGLDSDYWQLDRPFPDKKQFKQEVLEADLVLDNNVKLKYSNFGFGVLGQVIEAVSGQSYHEYIARHISRPLGENIQADLVKSLTSQLVMGYGQREINKKRLPIAAIQTGALAAAMGICATAASLSKFYEALLVGSGKLLNDESKKEMQRMHFPLMDSAGTVHGDYGLGLKLVRVNDRPMFGHGGGFPGQRTQTLADPKTKLVITVAINAIDGPAEEVLKGVYSAIDFFEAQPAPKTTLQRLEGLYANLWANGWIIAGRTGLSCIYPDSWQPFKQTDQLKRIDDTTFRIIKTDSIEAEDELVHFNLDGDTVTTVKYAGGTMWPLAAWREKQQNRSAITLKAHDEV
jgi:D-alanyl-D-alanine carboxypeptidase